MIPQHESMQQHYYTTLPCACTHEAIIFIIIALVAIPSIPQGVSMSSFASALQAGIMVTPSRVKAQRSLSHGIRTRAALPLDFKSPPNRSGKLTSDRVALPRPCGLDYFDVLGRIRTCTTSGAQRYMFPVSPLRRCSVGLSQATRSHT